MRLPSRIVELIRELRRRRVLQAAAVYATGAFVAVQVATNVFPALQFPSWTQTLVVMAALVGFPIVVVVWWQFEVTLEGIRRTVEAEETAEIVHARGTPWVALVMVGVVTVASAGIGWVAWDLWLEPGETPAQAGGEGGTREAPELPVERVAVFPFEDVSEDGSLEHVAHGLSRDLTYRLDQIDALELVPQRGTRPYADSDLPVDSVAVELNAGSLVTGTVESLEDSVVVRVQLVRAGEGSNLMNEEFTVPRDSVPTLRNELAEAAVREIQRWLGREIELSRERRGTTDREAWESFHEAERRVERGDSLRYAGASELAERQYLQADSLYGRAVERDADWIYPRIARGWLAFKRARVAGLAFDEADPALFRTAVRRATDVLRDDSGNAAALELRGVARSYLSQVPGVDSAGEIQRRALEDLNSAVAADQDRARAWVELAHILRGKGRLEDAKAAWDEANRADHFLQYEPDVIQVGAHLYLELGQVGRALEWAATGRRRYPNLRTFPQMELLTLPMQQAPVVPVDSVWAIYRDFGQRPDARILVAATLARLGYPDSARSVLESALRSLPDDQEVFAAYYEPVVWLNLGDHRRAVRLLEQAVERYDGYTRAYVANDAWWKPLHGDSAFAALVSGR